MANKSSLEKAETVENDSVESSDVTLEEAVPAVPEEAQAESEAISLEGDLGIVQIEELYDKMSGVLEKASDIEIDAAALNQVDTAAIQLLYAFVHDARSKGLNICWKSRSEALDAAAEQLGLSEYMGL